MLSKAEKRKEYKDALIFIVLGIVFATIIFSIPNFEYNIDLGRPLLSTHTILFGSILSVLWGLLKVFLTFLAFDKDDDSE
jgi:hypothetical protein